MPFSATAFICVYNEADVLPWTLKHLREQGMRVHVIDNWSTDGSADIARGFPLAGYELFPADGPSPHYSWAPLLGRVEELAAASGSDWCVHHDADEIRRSDRPGESMVDALARVAAGGYGRADHETLHFWPVDDEWDGSVSPEEHFRHYSEDGRSAQVKAWRNDGRRVDLRSSGGHAVVLPDASRGVYPAKMVLKHYPLRTSAQAERKVLAERVGRYDPAERARGWHVHWDDAARTKSWIRDPRMLKLWRGRTDMPRPQAV
jgi:glycosyltransferase involved in cell wall biosynthesis